MARMHAFAPAFVLAILVFWAAAVTVRPTRDRLICAVDRIERRTALPTLMLIGLILYWLARLVYAPAEFLRLVAF